jgi:hypothetical protein
MGVYSNDYFSLRQRKKIFYHGSVRFERANEVVKEEMLPVTPLLGDIVVGHHPKHDESKFIWKNIVPSIGLECYARNPIFRCFGSCNDVFGVIKLVSFNMASISAGRLTPHCRDNMEADPNTIDDSYSSANVCQLVRGLKAKLARIFYSRREVTYRLRSYYPMRILNKTKDRSRLSASLATFTDS